MQKLAVGEARAGWAAELRARACRCGAGGRMWAGRRALRRLACDVAVGEPRVCRASIGGRRAVGAEGKQAGKS